MTYYFKGSYPNEDRKMTYYYFGVEEDQMNTQIEILWGNMYLEHLELQKYEGRKYYSLNEIYDDIRLGCEKFKKEEKNNE